MAYFSDRIIDAVWEKANIVEGYNPDIWRQDFAKAWIRKDLYGAKHPFGWVIDHVLPISQNGTNDIQNLKPLQWQNNCQKGDNYPEFNTVITSMENKNIVKRQSWKMVKKVMA